MREVKFMRKDGQMYVTSVLFKTQRELDKFVKKMLRSGEYYLALAN